MQPVKPIQLSFKCPKSLSELKPCEEGYYCGSCRKIVHDLRGLSEDAIIARITENAGELCGIVEAQKVGIKPRMTGWKRWASAAILTLGLTGLYQTLFAQTKAEIQIDETKKPAKGAADGFLVGSIETEPTYIGGIDKFYAYIKANTPADVSNAYRHQRIIVTFTVGKDGKPGNAYIVRGKLNTDADKKIIAVINNSPAWHPGAQSGKVVDVQYTVPIQF